MRDFPGVIAAEKAAAGLRWQKSSHSNPSGNCVELARTVTGDVALRNSRDGDGPILICSREQVAALLEAVKHGEFDDLFG